ncbi:MAG: DUF1016 family protein [Planctomycetes bacterium]|nr:DUF1016 family protein [Planctomycetota bacterium]
MAQLREPHLWSVSWAHHVILMDEVLLNCHCNVVNDRLKHATDAPTIDSILCQTPDHFLAEYIFAGIDKPIDISTYDLTRALPARLQSALRTVEGIEADLPADLTLTPKTHRRKS